MDVSTAYLNEKLKEKLYFQPPEGVPIQSGYCWRLCHSIYGIKQVSWTWNKTLDKRLGELGFTHLDAETCLYVLWKSRDVCFLVVYMDNLLLAASSRSYMNSIKEMLSSSFKMHDLGEAKYLLGVEIQRDRKLT